MAHLIHELELAYVATTYINTSYTLLSFFIYDYEANLSYYFSILRAIFMNFGEILHQIKTYTKIILLFTKPNNHI